MLFVNRLHSLRASERARASCFSSRCRSSRLSLRQLSRRSGSTASRTAQPGSDSWLQSEKRHVERELVDVGERARETLGRLPELELAHAGGVEHEPAAGKPDQLARRRRVPAAPVEGADLLGRLALLAEQRVHERRLADARGAEQDDRPAGPEVRLELLEALAGDGADGVDGHADRDRLDLRDRRLGVLGQVELRQHDRRVGAALPRQREVALEPARVQVAVEGHDEEHRVDVRGQDLLDRLVAGGAADERRAPWQDGLDQPVGVGDPVADGRELAVVSAGDR